MNKIVAVVGMCGSGKSVLTAYFEEQGWKKVYFGGVTMKELEKRGLPRNEQNERAVREELRREYGKAAFAILLLDEIESLAKSSNVVLDGLYSWQEYKVLKERFKDSLSVLCIATNSGVRYERLSSREIRPLTKEEALSRDISEIENIEKGGPIAIADYYITNNGTTEELKEQFEDFLANL